MYWLPVVSTSFIYWLYVLGLWTPYQLYVLGQSCWSVLPSVIVTPCLNESVLEAFILIKALVGEV